ncbi:hypothetical protein SAMN02982989_3359 [Xaviernesmea oryzae]|uniref:Uncharacterized protein n=1 Tax=Xaviernesmea oryzae TaxID=464029 RepID=A0A1X7G7L1_9HYPH|nr:hypothetical protein [Xaviernesmea oryzae]SMF65453.1 hypothetical protein SAMN02982989_3359 [Xaviernesmea oryzae]
MSEIVGACLSQFHDDADSFELLLAYADGREVGFSVSRTVAQKIAAEFANCRNPIPANEGHPSIAVTVHPLPAKGN